MYCFIVLYAVSWKYAIERNFVLIFSINNFRSSQKYQIPAILTKFAKFIEYRNWWWDKLIGGKILFVKFIEMWSIWPLVWYQISRTSSLTESRHTYKKLCNCGLTYAKARWWHKTLKNGSQLRASNRKEEASHSSVRGLQRDNYEIDGHNYFCAYHCFSVTGWVWIYNFFYMELRLLLIIWNANFYFLQYEFYV